MKVKYAWIKRLGNIITILAVVLIIKKIYSYNLDYTFFLKPYALLLVGACLAAYMISVILGVIPWLKMVEIVSGKNIDYRAAIFVQVRSNLLKYLPGNIFQYVGKNELAIRCNIGHAQVAISTMLDIAVMLLVATLLGVLCSYKYLISILKLYISYKQIFLLVIGLLFLLLFLGLYARKQKHLTRDIIQILKKKENHRKILVCILYYIIQNFWMSIIYIVILTLVSGSGTGDYSLFLIIGANILSGVIGLLTPGAPGGLGIREMVMLMITHGLYNESTIMLASVIYRFISIIGDILSFLFIALIMNLKRSRIFRRKNFE